MAYASASERHQRGATTLANASLLPELQIPRTSKPLFEYLLRLGSSSLLFAGTGEPAKHSFLHMILLRAEPESSACFRSHAENETRCSTRCDAHPPSRFRRDRRPPHPIRRRAAADRLSSALVQAVSTALCLCRRFAPGAVVDRIRKATAKIAEAENLVAEVLYPVRFALLRNPRRHRAALTPQPELAFLSEKEWPYRLHASIHADAANHVLALPSCWRNLDREFFLFLCPQ